MIAYPSEYAVRIGRKFLENKDKSIPMDKVDFEVVFSESGQSISSDWFVGKRRQEMQENIPVEEYFADISDADAKNFLNTWFDALATAKYSDEIPGALDGGTFEFYSKGRAGGVYAPESGVPLLLTKSGLCLESYVKAPENKKGEQMKLCRGINEELRVEVAKNKNLSTK